MPQASLVAQINFHRGFAYHRKGLYRPAIADFEKALSLAPDMPEARNGLAWLFATATDPRARNGQRAVALALKACEQTKWQDPSILDTLAAAYAETGDFPDAVQWETSALQHCTTDRSLLDELNAHARLFAAKKPCREIPKR